MKNTRVTLSGHRAFLLVFSLLLFPPSLPAQKTVPATIITVTGDTIKGKCLNDPAHTNLHGITLIMEGTSSTGTFGPDRVQKAYVGGKYLQPFFVRQGTDSQQVFLHRVTFGYYTLLEGINAEGKTLYYLKLRDNKILPIPPGDHVSFLKKYFTGCPSVKPEKSYYDAVSLSNLIYKYGPCVEPGKYSRTRMRYNIRLSMGVSAGYNLSKLHFADDSYRYPTDDFTPGGGTDLAFLLVMNFNRSVEFETGVGHTTISGTLEDGEMTFDVNRSDVYIPLLVRFVPRLKSSLRPFVEGGLVPMFLAGSNTTITIPYSGTSEIEPGSSRLSFTGGAGVSFLTGRHQFRAKINYLNTHYLFNRKGARTDTYMNGSSWVFGLAYLFRVSK